MNIVLSEQQQQVLDQEKEKPPCVVDPRNNTAYYLVAASEYEAIRELLEGERRQRAIRAVGLRNAVGRMGEAP
jgi:PHD/YefM family antitoxin component YafN of YafNO toxin-antitoxin module